MKEVSNWDEIYGRYKAGYNMQFKMQNECACLGTAVRSEQLCEVFKYWAIAEPNTYCIVVCELKTIVLELLYFVAIQANYRGRTGTNDQPAGRKLFVPEYCCSYGA